MKSSFEWLMVHDDMYTCFEAGVALIGFFVRMNTPSNYSVDITATPSVQMTWEQW